MVELYTNNSYSSLGVRLGPIGVLQNIGLIRRDGEWVDEGKMDRGRPEKTEPLDRELTKRKGDTERKLLDLLEKRVSGRAGQTQRQR